jgi:hypothetical protein
MKAQEEVFEEREKRNVTGMSERYIPASRPAKTHQDYWKTKLKHPTFKGRDGTKYTPAEWYVRMFHLKREVWFCLDTANQAVAAVKARDIYVSLVSAGWEPTLAKYKPSAPVKVEVCTLGEFLEDVSAHGHFQPRTARKDFDLLLQVCNLGCIDALACFQNKGGVVFSLSKAFSHRCVVRKITKIDDPLSRGICDFGNTQRWQ